MTIKVGDTVPSVTLKRLGGEGLEDVNTGDLFKGRKVVMFSLPGAFTPTCSSRHLPGYVEAADALRKRGIDDIICVSVNDPWVMKAWGEAHGADGRVTMLPDGNGEFTKAMGLDKDMSAANLAVRGARCVMIIEDSKVTAIDIEEGREVTVSGADACLLKLD